MIHVFSGEIKQEDIAVINGNIGGTGKYDGKKTADLAERYVSPGFIDGHIHIESSMLTPSRFAGTVWGSVLSGDSGCSRAQ